MKIFYLIGGLGVGGAERQLLYLAEGVAPRAEVTVISLSETAVALLPRFQRLASVRTVILPKRLGMDLKLIPRLVRLCRRERPVILHTFLRTANYWGRVAACLAGVPVTIASERNIEVERGRIANCLDAVLASVTDRVVVNAAAIRQHLIKAERLAPEKLDVIHNGVPVSPLPLPADSEVVRRELGLVEREQLVVAFVGRLSHQKNPRLFLEMARSVLREGLKCAFVMVGDGPLREELAAQASALGIHEAVRFAGLRDDVPRILGSVDLLVLTSDWEGLPNVVLEALAAGVPAVATDVGGVREILADGVTGYVVPRRDLATLVERVIRLLRDPWLRMECGRRGRERVRSHFSTSSMISQTTALYDRLLQAKGLPSLPVP